MNQKTSQRDFFLQLHHNQTHTAMSNEKFNEEKKKLDEIKRRNEEIKAKLKASKK